MNHAPEHLHFVTGKLAEHALRTMVDRLAREYQFEYSVQVLPISVAALMTCRWVARQIQRPERADRVILPGYCEGDLGEIEQAVGVPVERGPRDLRKLPEHFGRAESLGLDYGRYDIEILAEINHAPRFSVAEILTQARNLAADGADLIDLGCDPGNTWLEVGDCVRRLRDEGLRVSVDSFNSNEIALATAAGAELVLSVNSSNRDAAPDWGREVVVIPDDFPTLGGLDDTLEFLARRNVPYRIDPILEPIGCGFAASLGRYLEVRRRYPEAPMLMGIGNLTELTDVDSSGVNVLLLGFCQEQGIRSVLTTQVINWARTSVRECDLARRLVFHAVDQRTPPKHVEPRLVTLRDPRVPEYGDAGLADLASQIRDRNYRMFAERGLLHLLNGEIRLTGSDPFELFRRLAETHPKNLDVSHAFYLGYELAKAVTALTLGKEYRQDEALDWGYLTVEEPSHRHASRPRS